jgi:anti-sigma B factor antagonist
MQMTLVDVAEDVVNVALAGRLDTPGVDRVETPLSAAVAQKNANALIDLSQVEFVGSMAIRMFMSVARAQAKRGLRVVLYAPQPLVGQLFDTVSLGDIIPVEADLQSALRAARG